MARPKAPKSSETPATVTEASATPATVTEATEATATPATPATPEARATFFISAKQLDIPGLTRDSVNKDPYYDPERLKLPIDAGNVATLASAGDTQSAGFPPIKVVKTTNGWTVVDGRRRTREAIAASDMRGSEVMVECLESEAPLTATPAEQFLAVRVSNSHRLNDSALALAKECQRAKRDFGISLVAFAKAMGIEEHQMRMFLVLTKLDLRLVELLEAGTITTTFAIQLVKISEDGDKQVEAYEQLKQKGLATVAGAKAKIVENAAKAAEAPKAEGSTPEAPKAAEAPKVKKTSTEVSHAEMRRMLASFGVEGFVCPLSDETIAVLRVLVGDTKPEEGPKGLGLCLASLRAGTLPQPAKASK